MESGGELVVIPCVHIVLQLFNRYKLLNEWGHKGTKCSAVVCSAILGCPQMTFEENKEDYIALHCTSFSFTTFLSSSASFLSSSISFATNLHLLHTSLLTHNPEQFRLPHLCLGLLQIPHTTCFIPRMVW